MNINTRNQSKNKKTVPQVQVPTATANPIATSSSNHNSSSVPKSNQQTPPPTVPPQTTNTSTNSTITQLSNSDNLSVCTIPAARERVLHGPPGSSKDSGVVISETPCTPNNQIDQFVYTGNNPVIGALTSATNQFSQLLNMLSRNVDRVASIGTAGENIEIATVIKDVAKTEAVSTMMKTVTSHTNNTSLDNLPSAGITYKITMKIKDFSGTYETPDPVEELLNATENAPFEFQIYDTYSSAVGEVVCIQEKEAFDYALKILQKHIMSNSRLFTSFFEIQTNVISSFSVKTDMFEKEILLKHNLVNGKPPVANIEGIKKLLTRYNQKWFKWTPIENVEVFGLNKPNSTSVSMKIHVSRETFHNFLITPQPRIMVHRKSVRIFEQIPVQQCLRCCSFEHTSRECNNELSCRFCGENDNSNNIFGHKTADCPNRSLANCPNCVKKAIDDGIILENPPCHAATSFACPLLKAEANRLRKKAKDDAMAPLNKIFNQ